MEKTNIKISIKIKEDFVGSNILYKIGRFYAISNDQRLGIYVTWSDCERYVIGYKKIKYQYFRSLEKVIDFVRNSKGLPCSSFCESLN